MFALLQRKLNNVLVFKNLISLNRAPLENYQKIKRIQDRNVYKLMRKAYQVPFYRQRFEQIGKTPEDFRTAESLAAFPILHKEEIRAWISEELKNNPEKYKHWYRITTSGSTGTPLMTCISPKENARLSANWLRIACKHGFHPFTDKTLALKDPELIKMRNGKDSILQKFGLLRRCCVSFLEDGKGILTMLNQEKPDFMYMHRSKLMQMLMYAERENLPVHKPKILAVIGEGIDQTAETFIDRYFPGIAYSSYGTMETGACTYTPSGNYKMHIITRDTHVINLVDETGQLADHGRMLLTNLYFYGFPVINYDIGDGGSWFVDPQTGLPYLTDLKGRLNDMLYFEDGSTVDYHSFYSVMERRKDILQFRIIQKTYHLLEVQLVRNNEAATLPNEKICQEIEDAIRKIIRLPQVKYQFTWHEELMPDKNGKRRFIVSEIQE